MMRCYYKGKKVGEMKGRTIVNYSDNYYVKGTRFTIGWERYAFSSGSDLWVQGPTKPASNVRYGTPPHDMSKNPGDYECKATHSGDTVREFAFTVGADGKVAPSDCQKELTLPPTLVLIPVKKAAVDAKYDKKAFAKSAFYSHPWPKGCPK
ncbi:MAG: hypothetical protein V1755_09130 [Chloroflexota bacterium]